MWCTRIQKSVRIKAFRFASLSRAVEKGGQGAPVPPPPRFVEQKNFFHVKRLFIEQDISDKK